MGISSDYSHDVLMISLVKQLGEKVLKYIMFVNTI